MTDTSQREDKEAVLQARQQRHCSEGIAGGKFKCKFKARQGKIRQGKAGRLIDSRCRQRQLG